MKAIPIPDRLVQPQSVVKKAREDFLVKGVIHHQIHPAIAESWENSKNLRVNPTMPVIPLKPLDSYYKYIEQNSLFLDAAEGVIQKLRVYMESSSSMIELFNSTGMIIKTYGDPKILKQAKMINNVPGGMWDEKVTGTNAVSLALKYQNPCLVIGAEHFCEMVHDWTCFAIPIFNGSTKNMLGVLDVTGPHEIFSPHTLGLIQAGAYAIEKMIDEHNTKMDFRLLDFYVQELSHGNNSLLVVNKYKTILRCTEKAASLFGGSPAHWLGTSIDGLAIPQLSYFMEIDETEVEFYATLVDDVDVRFVLKRVIDRQEFLGWLLSAYPVQARSLTFMEKPFPSFDALIGRSPSFLKAVETGKKIAGSHATVLLLGETGTGKEMFARAIHYSSPRRNGPFISVNCGAIPKELIASELFGYEEGAFSGAKKSGAKGKFELANGGTLFLDEIGELPLEQQVYLLRVLQERTIQRLGGNKEIPVDVRIIAATHVDLDEAVARKEFRQDLYYRLNIVSIHLPSLVERGSEDIIKLAEHSVTKYNRQEGKHVSLSLDVLRALAAYHWPGNVRELENTIYRLVVLCQSDTVTLDDLPLKIIENAAEPDAVTIQSEQRGVLAMDVPRKPKGIYAVERDEIIKAIRRTGGNYSQAAKQLGISRSTLYRKIEKYQIRL